MLEPRSVRVINWFCWQSYLADAARDLQRTSFSIKGEGLWLIWLSNLIAVETRRTLEKTYSSFTSKAQRINNNIHEYPWNPTSKFQANSPRRQHGPYPSNQRRQRLRPVAAWPQTTMELTNKPLATLSSFSYIPPRRSQPKEMSYFNKDSKVRSWKVFAKLASC